MIIEFTFYHCPEIPQLRKMKKITPIIINQVCFAENFAESISSNSKQPHQISFLLLLLQKQGADVNFGSVLWGRCQSG
jgi:hypothetical protein